MSCWGGRIKPSDGEVDGRSSKTGDDGVDEEEGTVKKELKNKVEKKSDERKEEGERVDKRR